MQKLLVFLFLGLLACQPDGQSQAVLDAAKTEAMLKSDPSVQLMDVRTPAEWQATGVRSPGSRRVGRQMERVLCLGRLAAHDRRDGRSASNKRGAQGLKPHAPRLFLVE